jgi:hypothetical protein
LTALGTVTVTVRSVPQLKFTDRMNGRKAYNERPVRSEWYQQRANKHDETPQVANSNTSMRCFDLGPNNIDMREKIIMIADFMGADTRRIWMSFWMSLKSERAEGSWSWW